MKRGCEWSMGIAKQIMFQQCTELVHNKVAVQNVKHWRDQQYASMTVSNLVVILHINDRLWSILYTLSPYIIANGR